MALLKAKEKEKERTIKKGLSKSRIFSEMTVENLLTTKKDLKEKIMKERFQMITGTITNVKHLSSLKKDYARILINLRKKKDS